MVITPQQNSQAQPTRCFLWLLPEKYANLPEKIRFSGSFRARPLHGDSQNSAELADVYQSCEFVDDRWNCQGTLDSNIWEHMDGAPSTTRVLAEGVDLTEWTSALEAPGRWVSNPTFYRWSGDATDPDNEPTPVSYRVEKVEMDLYQFQPQGVSGERGAVLVHGANGFDYRQ